VPVQPAVPAGEDGLFYCYKHKKETTRVTCGRCERPICTKCALFGSAGVRCRDCAKSNVAVRPRGLVHDVGTGFSRGTSGQKVWYLLIFAFFVNLIGSIFGRRDGF
jgi:hypothetical protein